jgi:hypothetical protein
MNHAASTFIEYFRAAGHTAAVPFLSFDEFSSLLTVKKR